MADSANAAPRKNGQPLDSHPSAPEAAVDPTPVEGLCGASAGTAADGLKCQLEQKIVALQGALEAVLDLKAAAEVKASILETENHRLMSMFVSVGCAKLHSHPMPLTGHLPGGYLAGAPLPGILLPCLSTSCSGNLRSPASITSASTLGTSPGVAPAASLSPSDQPLLPQQQQQQHTSPLGSSCTYPPGESSTTSGVGSLSSSPVRLSLPMYRPIRASRAGARVSFGPGADIDEHLRYTDDHRSIDVLRAENAAQARVLDVLREDYAAVVQQHAAVKKELQALRETVSKSVALLQNVRRRTSIPSCNSDGSDLSLLSSETCVTFPSGSHTGHGAALGVSVEPPSPPCHRQQRLRPAESLGWLPHATSQHHPHHPQEQPQELEQQSPPLPPSVALQMPGKDVLSASGLPSWLTPSPSLSGEDEVGYVGSTPEDSGFRKPRFPPEKLTEKLNERLGPDEDIEDEEMATAVPVSGQQVSGGWRSSLKGPRPEDLEDGEGDDDDEEVKKSVGGVCQTGGWRSALRGPRPEDLEEEVEPQSSSKNIPPPGVSNCVGEPGAQLSPEGRPAGGWRSALRGPQPEDLDDEDGDAPGGPVSAASAGGQRGVATQDGSSASTAAPEIKPSGGWRTALRGPRPEDLEDEDEERPAENRCGSAPPEQKPAASYGGYVSLEGLL
eukprot:RCo005998